MKSLVLELGANALYPVRHPTFTIVFKDPPVYTVPSRDPPLFYSELLPMSEATERALLRLLERHHRDTFYPMLVRALAKHRLSHPNP